MSRNQFENSRAIRYIVYNQKGTYMSAYSANTNAFPHKEAFKWAKQTADHSKGYIRVLRDDGREYEVYNHYSKSKGKR